MPRSKEEAIAAGVIIAETQHNMKRRKPWHDYHHKGTYMLTLVVEGRRPLLGNLVTAAAATPAATAAGLSAHVELTELGKDIRNEVVRKTTLLYPMVEIWKLCIMPDHIHMIVRIKEDLPEGKHLGQVVAGFKGGCSRAWWRLSRPGTDVQGVEASRRAVAVTTPAASAAGMAGKKPSLFEPGYNDLILLEQGQLDNWKRYLDDNPRRLALKRLHPDLFTTTHYIDIGEWHCQTVGNRFLLDIPQKVAVIVHRAYSDAEYADYRERWLACGEAGGVLVSAAFAHLDRELCPDLTTLYRRYYLRGSNTTNVSADYGYTLRHLSFAGETAIDGNGHVATVNSLSLQTSANFSLMALHRFYSYRYTSLHGHSFADGSNTQNESGFYIGTTWTPLPHLHLLAYADYAYHPWARYLVSRSSHSWDFFMQADWKRGRWSLQGRSRLHLRQRDNEDKTALTDYNDWRSRFLATYQDPAGWSSKTQLDLSRATFLTTERGWMLSQHLGLQKGSVRLQLSAGLFDTDGYLSRIYVYEHHLSREFSIPMFSGEGLRLALTARADLNSHLRLSAKVGYTNYFDRPVIGTSLQQIDHSSMTDLDIQLRWIL